MPPPLPVVLFVFSCSFKLFPSQTELSGAWLAFWPDSLELCLGRESMCSLYHLCTQRLVCEETQCHAFGLNRWVQSTELLRWLHLLLCVLSNSGGKAKDINKKTKKTYCETQQYRVYCATVCCYCHLKLSGAGS